MMGRPKLAVVRAAPIHVNPWQIQNFRHCIPFSVKFVTPSFYEAWHVNDKQHYSIRVKNLLPNFLRLKPIEHTFFISGDLNEALKDVDAIESPELFSLISYQCAKIAKRRGKKLVVTVWETIPFNPICNLVPPYLITRTVIRQSDMILAMTKKATRYLRSLSVPNEKIRVIYPGVDLQRFALPNGQKHENPRILFIGRLVPHKGILVLLEAFLRLHKEMPNVELWIAGKGWSWIESIVEDYARNYPIKYLSFVGYDALPEVYQKCDIFCLPCYDLKMAGVKLWEEQFGMVLGEAMACGLPIVTTNCGAIPEVVGSRNLVVPQRSVKDLYLALREILRDNDSRKFLMKDNRVRAEEMFNAEKQGIRLGKCLYSLLDDKYQKQ
jgi:glycosyltransferase involved in cell wall biosynthesis